MLHFATSFLRHKVCGTFIAPLNKQILTMLRYQWNTRLTLLTNNLTQKAMCNTNTNLHNPRIISPNHCEQFCSYCKNTILTQINLTQLKATLLNPIPGGGRAKPPVRLITHEPTLWQTCQWSVNLSLSVTVTSKKN